MARHYVFTIAFAADSTAWIAASDGLYRYDGYTWHQFGKKDGLPSDFVRAVCMDRQGRLWVGTDRGGGVFDGTSFRTLGLERELANRSVRRIFEDPDGSVWLCCDRWPDRSRPGGLTHWREGSIVSYGDKQGLTNDYIYGYALDSRGERHVFHRGGGSRMVGERWLPTAEPGLPPDYVSYQMVESAARDAFLSGSPGDPVLVRRAERWEAVPGTGGQPLCRTRAGEVWGARIDSPAGMLWLSRWDGARFAPVSSQFPVGRATVDVVAEAPDGSIWCVGPDLVVRWQRFGGEWMAYSGLPPARWVDPTRRVWFTERERAFRYEGTRFEPVPEWRGDALATADSLWSWVGDRICRWTAQGRGDYSRDDTGLVSVERVHEDGQGDVWFRGLDQAGHCAFAIRTAQGWRRLTLSQLDGQRIEREVEDARAGVWLLVRNTDSGHDTLIHVSLTRTSEAVLPPAYLNHRDSGVLADEQGIWLHGASGLHRRAPATRDAWERLPDLLGNNVYAALRCAGRICVVFDGRSGGGSGFGVLERGSWSQYPGEMGWFLGGSPRGAFHVAEGSGLRVIPPSGQGDAYRLALPAALPVQGVIEGVEDDLWLSSSNSVLHYRPASDPPRTVLEACDRRVRRGESVRLRLAGLKRWAPGHPRNAFRFSWQVDNGPWSPFQSEPVLYVPTRELALGTRRLKARCQLGESRVDPTPVEATFELDGVPLQERLWFKPAAVGLTALLALSATSASLARRKLARSARQLEAMVKERTAQLEQSNASLTREIAEREKTQEALRRSERQLRQAQKLESLGQLAGGVAHDFNNILAVIQGHCGLLLERAMDGRGRESLTQIAQSTERAAALTRQLLLFGRRQTMQARPLDLNALVDNLLQMLRRLLGEHIRLQFDRAPDLPPIAADPGMIEEVLMNLSVNARDAMPEGGLLRIATARVTWGPEAPRLNAEARAGQFVCLSVSDTGCGMDDAVRARVFEPFFTTKDVGKGSGLGLPAVYSIVKQHGGWTDVESVAGRGSTFRVYFPIESTGPS